MKITWLGQAGLLLEKGDFKIMIDPYFSDSVAKVNPKKLSPSADAGGILGGKARCADLYPQSS